MARSRKQKKTPKAKPVAPQIGKYTHAAQRAALAAKEAKKKLLAEAVAWCIEHGKSPSVCVREERFKELDRKWVEYRMRYNKRSQRDILTDTEKGSLYKWLTQSAANGRPVTEPVLADKIKHVLQTRLAYNRQHIL